MTKKIKNDFNINEFSAPDKQYSPVYTWIWNAPLNKETIKNQIDDLLAADIHGFYILPEPPEFRPDSMVTTLSPEYLSDDFMSFIHYAIEYAESKDMSVWLYDEGGWPSGSACGKVVRKKPDMYLKRLESTENGYVLRKISDFLPDIMEKETVTQFLNITHEQYNKHIHNFFGSTVRCIFTDEPFCCMPAWYADIEEDFKKMYGYDINFFRHVLYAADNLNQAEKKARIDYGELCSKRFRQNYMDRIRKWCNEHSLLSVGHLDKDHLAMSSVLMGYGNILYALRGFDIPGVDVITQQVMPSKKTEGMSFYPRFASSAASQNNTVFSLCEFFGVYGSGITYDQMRYIINYMAYRGINVFNLMSLSYGKKDFLAFCERPSFASEMPGYSNLKQLNRYASRLSYIMSLGKPMVETALYFPIRDIWALGDKAAKRFEELGETLEKNGIDFDILDDEAILNGIIAENGLQAGLSTYKYLYIPSCEYTNPEVLNKIEPFIVTTIKTGNYSRQRILQNGDILCFIYNESTSLQTVKADIDSRKYTYELSLQTGELYHMPTYPVCLCSGEERVYLFSDSEYIAKTSPMDYKFELVQTLNHFQAAKVYEFKVEKSGLNGYHTEPVYQKAEPGPWATYIGSELSGDISYTTEFDMNITQNEIVMLDLGIVKYSCKVILNGVEAGVLVMSPYRIILDNALIKKGKNHLEIIVSNTAANQFVYSDADKNWEEKELGTYHCRSKEYEKDSLESGLIGPVCLKKASDKI